MIVCTIDDANHYKGLSRALDMAIEWLVNKKNKQIKKISCQIKKRTQFYFIF